MISKTSNTTPRAARRPLMLAVSSALLSGAWGSGALAQGFPSEFDLDTLDGSNGFSVVSEEGSDDSFGRTVASAGDVNGDGIDDVIIGDRRAYDNLLIFAGSSYVVFGKATSETFADEINVSSLDGSNGFRLDGSTANDFSGHSVAGAGDINGDGVDDLIIGAPYYSGRLGKAYIVFGKDSTIGGNEFPGTLSLEDWTFDGTKGFRVNGQTFDTNYGHSVSAAGDFDGDGIDDVIIGSWFGSGAWVVLGKEATESDPVPFQPPPSLAGFPTQGTFVIANFPGVTDSVASAGDVNGDGIDDVIIGDSYADNNGGNSGSSYVVFGRGSASLARVSVQTDLDGSNGFRLDGEVGQRSGLTVASAGDINGDGIDDLLIWSKNTDQNPTILGRSYVVFGKDTTNAGNFPATLSLSSLDGSNGFRLDGSDAGAGFVPWTTAVSAAGDVNGDGIDDLIVTDDYRRCTGIGATETCTSSSYVLFGKDTTNDGPFPQALSLSSLNGSNGFRLFGETSGWLSARHHVAAAGDVNSDGIDDLIIGSPRAEPPRSYVVFGGISGPGLIPRVALDSTTLEFGDIELGQTAVRTLTVENNGTGTLSPGALSITGDQAGDFSIELNSCLDAQLATGESCTIDIGFAPTAPGIRQATLDLQSNAPSSPALVPLRGNNDGLFADAFEQKPGI